MKEMKSFILAMLFGGMLFSGCEKQLPETKENLRELDSGDMWLENGIPAYQNFKVFSEYIDEATSCTKEQRVEKENNQGFVSMQTRFEDDLDKFESLDENELPQFVADHEKYWVFTLDDGAFDILWTE